MSLHSDFELNFRDLLILGGIFRGRNCAEESSWVNLEKKLADIGLKWDFLVDNTRRDVKKGMKK